MKPFKFRLDTLLEFRKMKKDEAQLAFLQATNQLQTEQEALGHLEEKKRENVRLFTQQQQQGLPAEAFKSFNYYFDKIGKDIAAQQAKVAEAEVWRETCLASLVNAERDQRVVEKFKEKKLEQYQFEVLQEEQKELDEIGLQIHMRGK